MHRTSVRVNKTIQSWIPRPAKEGAGPCASLWEGPAGGWEWQRGGDVTTIPGAPPARLPTNTNVAAVKAVKKRKRIGCAALFFDAACKTAIWLRCVQCSVPSLRHILHPRFVDPPRLAIHEQNVQACHAEMLTWEDSEKCRVVLRRPRLVRRSMLPCSPP